MSRSLLIILRSRFSSQIRNFSASASTSSVDPEEIKKFNNLSSLWWDEAGEFKPLHTMNSLRIPYIRNGLVNSGAITASAANTALSLAGLKVLDVGCGGGILSEPLARIGAQVEGLDASEEAVRIAEEHAALDPNLKGRLRYRHGTLEEIASEGHLYDAVVMSEVLEHMSNQQQCISLASNLLKPNGSLFVTTLSRSCFSWLGGIVAAEYVLRVVPPGTHDWNKFITPAELKNILDDSGCATRSIHGMAYNILTNTWHWTSNSSINYALHAVKINTTEEEKAKKSSQL